VVRGGLSATALANTQSKFPDWHVWATKKMCFASRRGRVLSREELHAGLSMTVAADSPEDLDIKLMQQREAAQQIEKTAA
jgi:hypothetical protein